MFRLRATDRFWPPASGQVQAIDAGVAVLLKHGGAEPCELDAPMGQVLRTGCPIMNFHFHIVTDYDTLDFGFVQEEGKGQRRRGKID